MIQPDQFRKTLGRFASGVTVVTTETGDKVHGITVSAFISVSLTPPLIAICIDKRATSHGLLLSSSRFGVSILSESQQQLSDHFAGRAASAEVRFERLDGMPVLDGALAQLVCTKVASHEAGDHTLFIGQVDAAAVRETRPLVYYSGGYRRLAAEG